LHCFLNREFELSEIFSPHDAALDGTISGTDGLLVRDCSLHPGDLRIPVVDDLRVKLNLNDLTTEMVNMGSNNETLSPAGITVVNGNNVTWVDGILSGRHDEIWAVRKIKVYVSLEGEGEMQV